MDQDFRVVVSESADAAAEFSGPWSALAQNASELNVFYEPWIFLPAWRRLNHESVRAVFIFSGPPENATSELVGFFPLVFRTGRRGLPLAHVSLWRYIHCYLCTPLIRAGVERATIAAFLDWLQNWSDRGKVCSWNHIGADGPVAAALTTVLEANGAGFNWRRLKSRPCLQSALDFESYLTQNVSGKKRKEYRRQRKRLAEVGCLATRVWPGPDGDQGDLESWIDEFLALEATGWKGNSGTALAQSANEAEFFREIVRSGAASGKIMLLKFTLDGQAIAMKCNFISGQGCFAFKIAFAEQYAQYSPGVLLELDTMEYILNARPVEWIDSCAETENSVVEHLWRERRTLGSFDISTGHWLSEAALAVLKAGRAVSRVPSFGF